MSSKTKIVVLHMKEIIYTAIFVLLGILLIILLAIMFSSKKSTNTNSDIFYEPGVYTSTMTLNNTDLEVEVFVDSSHINAIRITNLNETVETMYPLVQPTVEYIADQIYEKQSLEDISLSSESPYTSQLLLNTIDDALQKSRQTD